MELAFRCGVTQATASRWLSGVSPVSPVNSEFIRAEMALDAGRPSWPPPSFDELMKLLRRK
jgi:transcriptional regulator with XRE-family HTH domain